VRVGVIKVGDFGVTKLLESTAAMAKTTIGTPYYISPEICLEQPYSYASDVWAIGVLMYELCALTVPFNAKDFASLRRVILETKPASLSRFALAW
jgi:serine/threonine protein kinase